MEETTAYKPGAFILVVTIGTVVFLPLEVPLMIKGLEVSAWALAKPLLTMVLLPLEGDAQRSGQLCRWRAGPPLYLNNIGVV
jgi:hypothetical protein